MLCPQCATSRKKKHVKTLSVEVEEGVAYCHHCDWRASLKSGQESRSNPSWWEDPDKPKVYRKPAPVERDKSDDAYRQRRAWADRMQERGISGETIKRAGCDVVLKWMPQVEAEVWTLAYPYRRNGELINVKYRDAEKNFRMEAGAEQILWRLDEIARPDHEAIIITEGENDCLALMETGYENVTSVPAGAPNADAKSYETKFAFLEDEYTQRVIASKKRFILAVDGDPNGRKLRQELTRRFDPARCWYVTWPEDCKDANDVLKTHGPVRLREVIDGAKPAPLDGILTVDDFRDEMDDLYVYGLPTGLSTGWRSLDRKDDGSPLFTIGPGLLAIVTGPGGTGKSRFINAMAINVSRQHRWRWGVCSPEYRPHTLLLKHLAETYVGKSMDLDASPRMTPDEYRIAMDWVRAHFYLIAPEEMTVRSILAKATGLASRYGINGLIIDPWTEVDTDDEAKGNDAKILRGALSDIQRWQRLTNVTTIINAHPTAAANRADEGGHIVGMSDISGGAMFGNKADYILSLHRDREASDGLMDIHVKKARFQHLGGYGMATLQFDRATGRYRDAPRREREDG